ncbi:MAG: sigma-70 family RNA polymerase sigma factor [Planctomycetaceae bacterium]|nr:sigma-70 family RNA polymerase sigma factor [Planctomycetaceae bacterium]
MPVETKQLLEQARAGNTAELGQLLEPYRHYLKLLARVQIGKRVQGKADESDLVQDTFLDAHRNITNFRGDTEAQLLEWLRTILAAKLADLLRRYLGTRQRNVAVEREIGDGFNQSTAMLGAGLVSPESSPSQRASRHEEALRLADALAELPANYREAIVLRNIEGLPFAEVANRMGKTVNSVEKLWLRGLAALRKQLEEDRR